MMAAKMQAELVSLFGRGPDLDDEPEVSVRMAPAATAAATPAKRSAAALNLTSKPKTWFLVGAGGTGKTMLARWLGWQMQAAGRAAILAALDPQNRSLTTWFENVEQPPSSDGVQTSRWLRDLLKYVMAERQSALLDFGGGDTALLRLIEAVPDFVAALEEAGVEPVACYMLAPRQDDLAILETLEAARFTPRATALVLNEGRVDSTLSRDEAFARVRRHSALKSALTRGAVPIWMPRLEPEVAQDIEGKRLQFGQARDGQVPDGARFAPIGGFERSMVRRWMERMDQEFEPIKTWLP